MFYPLIKLDYFDGFTTIHNFSPNNWEKINLSKKYVYIIWSDGNKWQTKFISKLEINESIEINTKNLNDEIFVNRVAFLYPSNSLLNSNLDFLPVDNDFNTKTPSWRSTIGIENSITRVSYQGEIEPFPQKSSLLTFHPFIQYNNFNNYLLLINLLKSPEIINSNLEIYNGFKGEFIDKQIIKTNSISLIPLNQYNFHEKDLPFFISRDVSAIPFGFGYNEDQSILSLEHTHPPSNLIIHGNRNIFQKMIKSNWFNKLNP